MRSSRGFFRSCSCILNSLLCCGQKVTFQTTEFNFPFFYSARSIFSLAPSREGEEPDVCWGCGHVCGVVLCFLDRCAARCFHETRCKLASLSRLKKRNAERKHFTEEVLSCFCQPLSLLLSRLKVTITCTQSGHIKYLHTYYVCSHILYTYTYYVNVTLSIIKFDILLLSKHSHMQI